VRKSHAHWTSALVGAALAAAALHARADDDLPKVVRDLAYGEVLFHYFKDDHFSALTRLLAGLERDELPSHARDADILLGALYLSYGQHRLAGQVFEQVLAGSVEPELHDRAWFFLAKIWRQRGYLAEAEAALARIGEELPEELEAERRMLEAEVLMDQQRFDAALAVLESWKKPSDQWVGFAKYNVGVALVRLGRTEEGARVLAEVGQLDIENPALAPLRDKANVALGYAWLQGGRPAEAKPSLQRVRLDGPYSNKALLGVGWADAELGDYEAALRPWIELGGRDLLDSAVQESLLAVPYAFAQLGADRQAADYYTAAIDAFNEELLRLDTSIIAIETGQLIDDLLAREPADGSGWFWHLEELPETAETRYLYELMATNRFQESLKTYRDLKYLHDNLDRWVGSLDTFDSILQTRQRAYEERLPAIDASLARIDLDQMARQRVELESRLLEIERAQDAVALGTPAQQEAWRTLTEMEPDLARVGNDERAEELRRKQRFFKGLLLWELRRDFPARLWAEQKSLRELDRELKEARRRHHEVSSARDTWPQQFASLTGRIAALTPRVEALRATARGTLEQQRAFVQGIAVEELQAQRERVNTYLTQARFALASVYDRAAASTGAPPAESALAEQRP
jgi:tetratricopeptide (TPR) repeat protein